MDALAAARVETPLGTMTIAASERGLALATFDEPPLDVALVEQPNTHVDDARDWLAAYFAGEVARPRPALDARGGSDFARAVWAALLEIPAGEVRTYAELAAHIGHPGASRAVGMANHGNPLCIIVPCHRVVAAGGKLGGYGAGLPRKRWLLAHEHVHHARFALTPP